MNHASLGPIAIYLPERVETNAQLKEEFPEWDVDLIYSKTGIAARHLAGENECASDLAEAAARRLFAEQAIDPASIDFVLLCTQTPDYPLPTTACLLQHRLGLRTNIGALDFNLGCSGFVYGLALADGLIRGGACRRLLLLTADTYSKFIHPADRSLRTIFGDGAAATLIEAAPEPSLSGFCFGADGSGANTLFVDQHSLRPPGHRLKPSGRRRWPSPLYMDGPGLMKFSLEAVPALVRQVRAASGWSDERIDYYLFHQATWKMLDELRQLLGLKFDRLPLAMDDCGNTVSSTIPILIQRMRADGRLRPGKQSLLIGFGVGWSWAGCAWQETWPSGPV